MRSSDSRLYNWCMVFKVSAILTMATVGCSRRDQANDPRVEFAVVENEAMQMETLVLDCNRGILKLSVLPTAPGLQPIEDYREVHATIPGKGRYRAVLWLLSDKESDDPLAIMPVEQWTVPARWDDNTMLFVPSFKPDHILAAFRYVLDNNLEAAAFEHEDDIDF